MEDLSSVKINWPVPGRPLGGNGSPVAASTNGSAWNSFASATQENNTPGEDVISGEGSEPSGEGAE